LPSKTPDFWAKKDPTIRQTKNCFSNFQQQIITKKADNSTVEGKSLILRQIDQAEG